MMAKSSIGSRLSSPAAAICAAADAGKSQRLGGALPQRAHQRRAEPVAGFLGRNEKYLELAGRSARPAHRRSSGVPSASTPMTNILARSAAAAMRSGSATIVEPATTAMPARPAAAAASTVGGPITGRSMRWSWPRFGALISTPVPGGGRMRPLRRKLRHPRQRPIGALRPLHAPARDCRRRPRPDRCRTGSSRAATPARARCRRGPARPATVPPSRPVRHQQAPARSRRRRAGGSRAARKCRPMPDCRWSSPPRKSCTSCGISAQRAEIGPDRARATAASPSR